MGCLNKSDIHADGILSGVLTRGLLTDVLGASDQACAKWDLIENLNLLGFTKQGQNGQSCKSITACCPEARSPATSTKDFALWQQESLNIAGIEGIVVAKSSIMGLVLDSTFASAAVLWTSVLSYGLAIN